MIENSQHCEYYLQNRLSTEVEMKKTLRKHRSNKLSVHPQVDLKPDCDSGIVLHVSAQEDNLSAKIDINSLRRQFSRAILLQYIQGYHFGHSLAGCSDHLLSKMCTVKALN
ncbi:uncharacterized protein [Rhodnius prolixus]|uniref:uncharacterized protein n=1 Tax=Rhodnius prolixus TaxID=13249 RepID=UPI003D18E1D8